MALRPTDEDGWGPKWLTDVSGVPRGELTIRPRAAGVSHELVVRVVGATLDTTIGPVDLGMSDGSDQNYQVALPQAATTQPGLVLVVVKLTAINGEGRVLAYMSSDRVYVSGPSSSAEQWFTEAEAEARIAATRMPSDDGTIEFGLIGRDVTP